MMTEQFPLQSGFGPATTSEEIMAGHSQSGKTALVTGGYSGLGLEVTRMLAQAGANVIVPARDIDKAQANLAGISGVELLSLDLTDPESIATSARQVLALAPSLEMVINSAGVMLTELARDSRGYESHFSTNHLGHFELISHLWPALRAGRARVVAISSRAHHYAPMDFDDPNFTARTFNPWTAYAQSKTANALFAVELDRRGAAHSIRAFSVHPGVIVTPFARHVPPQQLVEMGLIDSDGRLVIDPETDKKTVSQGAATGLWCAVSPQLVDEGGVYCENCDIAVRASADALESPGVMSWAIDPHAASRLWALSEGLTGVTFPG